MMKKMGFKPGQGLGASEGETSTSQDSTPFASGTEEEDTPKMGAAPKRPRTEPIRFEMHTGKFP